jgi:hypothetical protein
MHYFNANRDTLSWSYSAFKKGVIGEETQIGFSAAEAKRLDDIRSTGSKNNRNLYFRAGAITTLKSKFTSTYTTGCLQWLYELLDDAECQSHFTPLAST